MKYLYAFIVAFIWSIPALAQNTIDTSNLPRKQQAEVALLAAQLAVGKTDAASTRESNVKASNSLADWANVGSSIGQAFGSAAKEVGIAINDFANSPVGRVAMALIVWHFIGGALIHFIGGLFVIIIGLSFILWLVKRTYPTTYQYDTSKTNIFGNYPVTHSQREAIGSEVGGWLFCAGVVIFAGIVTMLTF